MQFLSHFCFNANSFEHFPTRPISLVAHTVYTHPTIDNLNAFILLLQNFPFSNKPRFWFWRFRSFGDLQTSVVTQSQKGPPRLTQHASAKRTLTSCCRALVQTMKTLRQIDETHLLLVLYLVWLG